MVRFEKGDNQSSRFKIDATSFLKGEGGATIASIDSFERLSGDVELGSSVDAPGIVDAGKSILFKLSGGTADTTTEFEIRFTTSTGDNFDVRLNISVLKSLL